MENLIRQGAPAIMTSHINLEAYQQEKIAGSYPPATMSYELTTNLLRRELKFDNVIVTDALVMASFSGANAVDNMVRSFLAGNDMLLWPAYEYIDRMEQLILEGKIAESVLDAAVERIWKLKEKYGILDGKELNGAAEADFFESRARLLAENAITLVQDPKNILPVDRENVKKVLLIAVTPDDKQFAQLKDFKTALENLGCVVTMQRNISPEDGLQLQKDFDLSIFALCRTPHRPIGPLDFWAEEAVSIWASNGMDKGKTLAVSFGSPYLYRYYRNSGMTYINAYGCTTESTQAVAKAIFGMIPFRGKSPVKLG